MAFELGTSNVIVVFIYANPNSDVCCRSSILFEKAETPEPISLLSFENVSFVVPSKGKAPAKKILTRISGGLSSGRVLAIMGKSSSKVAYFFFFY